MRPEPKYSKLPSYRSSLCDWLIIICLISVTAVLESPNRLPYYQCVPGWTQVHNSDTYLCGDDYDPELQFPYKPSSIDTKLLFILSFGPWIFTIVINIMLLYCSQPIYSHKVILKHIEILSRMLMFSAWSTEALVSVIKFSVGRPRPNFYALMNEARTQNDHKQARMSFPSGHSSLSFSVLFLLTLNLYSAMRYVQFRDHKKNAMKPSITNAHSYFYLRLWWYLRYYKLLSVLLVFVPTCLAVYIACTRVTDYWHHYADVAVGSLLGIAGAIVSFALYRDELYPMFGKHYQPKLFAPIVEVDEIEHNQPAYVINEVHDVLSHPLETDRAEILDNRAVQDVA